MTPDASPSPNAGDEVSPAGDIYRKMVGGLLAAERDRRTNLMSRADKLLTSSGTLLALVGAVTAFVIGKDATFESRTAVLELCKALPWFVLSAVVALVVQTKGWPYTVVNEESVAELTAADQFWKGSPDIAAREDAHQQGETLKTLRRGNDDMAVWILVSLNLQVVAITLVSVAVGFELWARLTAIKP